MCSRKKENNSVSLEDRRISCPSFFAGTCLDQGSGLALKNFVPADHGFHLGAQHHWIKGLCDVVVRPQLQTVERVIVFIFSADDNDRCQIAGPADLLQKLKPVHSSHGDVKKNEIIGPAAQGKKRFLSAGNCLGFQLIASQHFAEKPLDHWVIIYDQYRFARHNQVDSFPGI